MPQEMSKNQKVWAQFWSAHQRFFKYLCISAKVYTFYNLFCSEYILFLINLNFLRFKLV